ncbi:MAG: MBL fold metallo-hydrolase [Pseudomonadales bacterium]
MSQSRQKHRRQQLRLLCAVTAAACLALWLSSASAADADRFKDVKVTSTEIVPGLHMLTGAGGNIAASVGPDGTLIVDTQYGPLAKRILRALNRIDGDAPKLVINTHYHGDHTGSNGAFGTAGTIIAHANVHARLIGDSALQRSAMPSVTFKDRLRLHFNNDAIDLIHMPAGHTDGDAVVWFRNANVIHMGDHYFRANFPYVDIDAGGSVSGVIDNLESILRMAPADITVIPGHGPIATLKELGETLNMLRQTSAMVRQQLANGASEATLIKQGLGAQWQSWGNGFINEERWIRTLVKDAGLPQ